MLGSPRTFFGAELLEIDKNSFSKWLLEEIEARKLTYSDVARRGGISHARISQVLAGESPGKRFCHGIARAFSVPPKEVFQRAGLLPQEPDDDELTELALHLFRNLDERQQRDIVTMLQSLIEKRKAKEREE